MPKPPTSKPTAPLNRQDCVEVALLVISEAGVKKMSMRKVASSLGVSAMAMYKHVPQHRRTDGRHPQCRHCQGRCIPLRTGVVSMARASRLAREGFNTEKSGRAYLAVIQAVIGGVCLHASIEAQRQVQATVTQTYPADATTLRTGQSRRP